MRNNISRTIDWRLTLNGAVVTGGTMTDANAYTSSNPFNLANGSGGAAALSIPVVAGDVIGIDAGRMTPFVDSDFVGVELSIAVVPEPSTWSLVGLGFAGVIAARRNKPASGQQRPI
jgi:hypothetical protein